MNKETRHKFLLLIGVFLICNVIAYVLHIYIEQRHDDVYEQMENQGYDMFDMTPDTVKLGEVKMDTLFIDTAVVDTVVGIEYLHNEETYKKAKMSKKILEELRCPISRVDTDYNRIVFNFKYEDENMRLIVKENKPGIVIEDNPWDSIDPNNTLALYAMWNTINAFNASFPFKIQYFEDEDGVVRIFSTHQIHIYRETPNKAKFVESIIRNMIRVHEHFHEAMIGVMNDVRASD